VSGASPSPPPEPAFVEPYRVLFPIGAVFAIAGTGVWIAHAFGAAYPAVLHRTWMMEGFELCFVLGFLLTAMPALTHGARCTPWERHMAVTAAALVGAGGLANVPALAHAGFAGGVLLLLSAAARRIFTGPSRPAEEFAFVGLGLVLGLAGGVLQMAAALGGFQDPAPNFAARLVSLGMVLSLVLGVGSLLVPAFLGMRQPLVIPGVAGAHERRGRRVLYAGVLLALLGAFAFEASGLTSPGAWLRAAAAATMILWVWKLWRRPGRTGAPAFALWISGWLILLGLVLAAVLPSHAIAALHVTFLGGFGLLTLAIGTRVVVSHGRRPLAEEARLIPIPVVVLIALALVMRVGADFAPGDLRHAYAGSAALWILAWTWWARGAFAGTRKVSAAVVRTN
jgi:uncharacterized protein involved in response to NO